MMGSLIYNASGKKEDQPAQGSASAFGERRSSNVQSNDKKPPTVSQFNAHETHQSKEGSQNRSSIGGGVARIGSFVKKVSNSVKSGGSDGQGSIVTSLSDLEKIEKLMN